jgi:hypothetical protein
VTKKSRQIDKRLLNDGHLRQPNKRSGISTSSLRRFIFTTAIVFQVSYFVGNEHYTISHGSAPYSCVYRRSCKGARRPLPSRLHPCTQPRIPADLKDMHIYSYSLSLSVVEYQTAILRDAAAEILPSPKRPAQQSRTFLRKQRYPNPLHPTPSTNTVSTLLQTSKNSPSK